MEKIREIQIILIEILKDFDAICKNNRIEYWVEGGTFLGSVRHGGFIPWDDDIDIGMTRDNYNKFINLDLGIFREKYFIQTPKTDKYTLHTFCRFRKNGTRVISERELNFNLTNHHQGLFIDVFPFDFVSKNVKNSLFHNILCKFFLVRRCSFYHPTSTFKKSFSRVTSLLIPFNLIYKIANSVYNRGNEKLITIGYDTQFRGGNFTYETKNFFPLCEIEFEGIKVPCPKDKHYYLSKKYGDDYMTPHGESDRHIHFISFELEK